MKRHSRAAKAIALILAGGSVTQLGGCDPIGTIISLVTLPLFFSTFSNLIAQMNSTTGTEP